MDALSEITNSGISFLLTLVFGFWLSKVGKPYNGILFNIHKLIALGTVILVSMQLYEALKARELQVLIILLIAGAAIGVIALFATGAFMSIGKLNFRALKTIHTLAPLVLVTVMALAIFLLVRNPL